MFGCVSRLLTGSCRLYFFFFVRLLCEGLYEMDALDSAISFLFSAGAQLHPPPNSSALSQSMGWRWWGGWRCRYPRLANRWDFCFCFFFAFVLSAGRRLRLVAWLCGDRWVSPVIACTCDPSASDPYSLSSLCVSAWSMFLDGGHWSFFMANAAACVGWCCWAFSIRRLTAWGRNYSLSPPRVVRSFPTLRAVITFGGRDPRAFLSFCLSFFCTTSRPLKHILILNIPFSHSNNQ